MVVMERKIIKKIRHISGWVELSIFLSIVMHDVSQVSLCTRRTNPYSRLSIIVVNHVFMLIIKFKWTNYLWLRLYY